MAQRQLFDPQDNDGQGGGQGGSLAKKARRAEQRAQWLLHYVKAEESRSRVSAKEARAQLILPPGLQRDAGIEHFLQRYNTDPEFHAKIEAAVQEQLQQERDRIIFGPDNKEYVIRTADDLPANNAAAMLEELREIRTWAEIEKLALTEQERQEELERSLTCIWCGQVCEDPDALEAHEDDCA